MESPYGVRLIRNRHNYIVCYTSCVNDVSNILFPLIVVNQARQQPAAATSQNLFGGGNDSTGNKILS